MHATFSANGTASWSATTSPATRPASSKALPRSAAWPTPRRKFFDLHAANKSQLAEQALHSIAGLYEIERQPDLEMLRDQWQTEANAVLRQSEEDWRRRAGLLPKGPKP
jgi:hypothetical protein